MARFKRKGEKGTPGISTASLPDIIFMLLFFFMVATTMREVTYIVDINLPKATQVKKLEKKSLVSYIYVGKPSKQYRKKYGTEPRIQLNDQFADLTDIRLFIESEKEARDPADRPLLTTSLKVDGDTKMGIITDIKTQLRKSESLKINYSSRRKSSDE